MAGFVRLRTHHLMANHRDHIWTHGVQGPSSKLTRTRFIHGNSRRNFAKLIMKENVGVWIPGCRSPKKFQSGVRKGNSRIRMVVMRLSWEGIKIVVVNLTIFPAERCFCLIAILISVFSATLWAQTSSEIGTYSLSGWLTPLGSC